MTSIVIHPTYFPSIAQMAVVAQADSVIFEVCDNYQKQTYRNRSYIAHNNGRLLLNVPVKHQKGGARQKSATVICEHSFPWQSQHWKSLQTAYRTSPFFEYYEDELAPLFLTTVSELMQHNLNIYKTLCDLIGLDADFKTTLSYETAPKEIDYRSLVNAKKEPDFNLQPYIQVLEAHHGFLSNLSVLDLLFNEGPNTLQYLEAQRIPVL